MRFVLSIFEFFLSIFQVKVVVDAVEEESNQKGFVFHHLSVCFYIFLKLVYFDKLQ